MGQSFLSEKELLKFLDSSLIRQGAPGNGDYFSVDRQGVRKLARHMNCSLRKSLLFCLENDIWPECFKQNRGSLTAKEQAKLVQSNVAVLGAGGLGGYVVTLLARLGIGMLVICDGDVFEESNLNRQLFCNLETLGREKAFCAQEAAIRINPACESKVYAVWATSKNLPSILANTHAAVDCLDNLSCRYELEEACNAIGIPYVHGALAGWEGFVMTVFPGQAGLAGVYGPNPVEKRDSAETVLGVPTPTPATVASFQVSELVKVLLDKIDKTQKRMLHIDLTQPMVETMNLS